MHARQKSFFFPRGILALNPTAQFSNACRRGLLFALSRVTSEFKRKTHALLSAWEKNSTSLDPIWPNTLYF
jgi:hypothetical protein